MKNEFNPRGPRASDATHARAAHAHARPAGAAHAGRGPTARKQPATGRPARAGHLCKTAPTLTAIHPITMRPIPTVGT